MITKTKDWLLLNAIECWLYYYADKHEYGQAYRELRDEYRVLVAAPDSKDAPVDEPTPTPKRTRSRSTK